MKDPKDINILIACEESQAIYAKSSENSDITLLAVI